MEAPDKGRDKNSNRDDPSKEVIDLEEVYGKGKIVRNIRNNTNNRRIDYNTL